MLLAIDIESIRLILGYISMAMAINALETRKFYIVYETETQNSHTDAADADTDADTELESLIETRDTRLARTGRVRASSVPCASRGFTASSVTACGPDVPTPDSRPRDPRDLLSALG